MLKGPQGSSHRTLACVCRYKQQLSLAVERGQSLEREQVQLGLDWQRRCDDIERDQIQKSETLIEGLTKARDQVCWVLWVWSMSGTVHCTGWVCMSNTVQYCSYSDEQYWVCTVLLILKS